jgi:hypothetical protein
MPAKVSQEGQASGPLMVAYVPTLYSRYILNVPPDGAAYVPNMQVFSSGINIRVLNPSLHRIWHPDRWNPALEYWD